MAAAMTDNADATMYYGLNRGAPASVDETALAVLLDLFWPRGFWFPFSLSAPDGDWARSDSIELSGGILAWRGVLGVPSRRRNQITFS